MAPAYLSVSESTVTVDLSRFSIWDPASSHVAHHTEVLDHVSRIHPLFSVEVDAANFGPTHLAALPTFYSLAALCRERYKSKLESVTIYNCPALLRTVAQQLRPAIGTQTWDKIFFK